MIKTTSSLCPVCKENIAAEIYEEDSKIYMKKSCLSHGEFNVLINSDSKMYYDSRGENSCGPSSGCCGHNPDLIERASTCIALIEIVESCNLKCPTCYAGSPFTAPNDIQYKTTKEVQDQISSVISRKGMLDIVQLSGGEPTIHPEFFTLLEWVQTHEQIGYCLLNTNGVRIAAEDDFAKQLGELHRTHRGFEIYLQFDGTQEIGQRELRGTDLREMRERVIARCEEEKLPVTLAMTVTEDTMPYLGDTLQLALKNEAIRGITFQPMFTSGRRPDELVQLRRSSSTSYTGLNVADIAHAVIDQSQGILSEKDFTPLPCGDPNCHTVGYLLRKNDTVIPVSQVLDFDTVQGFLKDRIDFSIEDLEQCGCESEELGHLLKALELGPDNVLRLFIKPFMDAWTYDQDRIDRCCVHVIGEGGSLESFCRHYALQ